MTRFRYTTAWTIAFISILLSHQVQAESHAIENIDGFEWTKRIILLKSDKLDSTAVMKRLMRAREEVADRHILWFLLEDDKVTSNYRGAISERFSNQIGSSYFQNPDVNVVLLGKDGGVKYSSSELDLGEIFSRIDAMPMRRFEMKRGPSDSR